MSARVHHALLEACGVKGSIAEVKRLLRVTTDVNAVRKTDGATALTEAAKFGLDDQESQDIIKLLLEHGAQPDAQTKAGMTALILACERGNNEIARVLLDHHADANQCKPTTGTTALICACRFRDVGLVSLLLDRGANVDLAAKKGLTALMVAAKDGQLEIARLLIDRGASLDIQSDEGSTALLFACRGRKTSIAELLIERGANLNLQDDMGCTPLMWASKLGPLATVKLLVDHGADVNLQNGDGSTALIRACKKRSITIASFLIERGANPDICDRFGRSALMYECRKLYGVNKKFVELLLDRGAKIAVGNESAFFEACSKGYLEIVRILLAYGVEIDARDEFGMTGLMMACRSSSRCVKLLLKRGADVSIRSREGLTALMLASKHGAGASVRVLLDHRNVAINEQIDDGSTALMQALRPLCSDTGAIKALLARGADTNIQRQDGSTALMLASLRVPPHAPSVGLLLDAGANPNLQRRDGITALMIQCVRHNDSDDSRHRIQVELLMRNGADLGLRDSWGWSALEFAWVDRLQFDSHARLLLRRAADRPSTSNEYAAKAERRKLVEKTKLALLLVDAGAPLDFSHVPSVKAQETLTIASRNGYVEVLQVLLLRNPYRTFPVEQPPPESTFPEFMRSLAKRRRRARS